MVGRSARVLARLRPWLGVLLLGAAVLALAHTLRQAPPAEVARAALAVGPVGLLLCALLTAVCYLLLSFYDVLGWRHIGARVPYPEVARASFVGYGLSHTIGASLVTGALARDRIHAHRGIGGVRVAGLVAFCGLTSFLGYLAFSALTLLVWPEHAHVAGLDAVGSRAAGLAALALVGLYVGACALRLKGLRIRGRVWTLPTPRLAFAQVGLSGLEWAIAALALAPLLPGGYPMGAMLVAFTLAKTAAFVIHTPGGLGVFEAAMLALAPAAAPAAGVLGALIVYRALHFLVPFLLAAAMLGMHELRARTSPAGCSGPAPLRRSRGS